MAKLSVRILATLLTTTVAVGAPAQEIPTPVDPSQVYNDVSIPLPTPQQGTEVISAGPSLDPACDPSLYEPVSEIAFTLTVPCLNPGFEFHAGVLFLQPSADNLGWGVVTFEENFDSPVPIASPYWVIQTLEPGYDPGLEVGGRYVFARPGTDFRMNWQHLRTSTSDSVVPTQETGQWVSPFSQTGPPTAETYEELAEDEGVNKLRFADAEVEFAYDQVDFDFGQSVNVGPSLELRFFAGVSFARLQDRIVSNFHGVPPDPNAPFPENVPLLISLNNTSTYTGAGPRFGLDSTIAVPYGFRLTSQLAGALLIGSKQPAQYLFSATSPELAAVGIEVNDESINSESFTEVVYACDAKLGLGYTYVFAGGSRFTLDGGYMAAVYTDPFSGYETNENILALQIGSLSSGSIRHTQSDFTLNGFYMTGGFMW